jgi:hypothetical protein
MAGTGKSYQTGRLSTVSLLVLASLDQLFFYKENYIYFFYKTSYLNEEVNRTEPFPLVRIPWLEASHIKCFKNCEQV